MLEQHFPGQPPIDAYGNNGFRFADMSHRGGLLFLPSGVYGWAIDDIVTAEPDTFAAVIDPSQAIEVLLIGTGIAHQPLPDDVTKALVEAKLGYEIMSTGAAARTYNVLLAEHRRVAAALVPVP